MDNLWVLKNYKDKDYYAEIGKCQTYARTVYLAKSFKSKSAAQKKAWGIYSNYIPVKFSQAAKDEYTDFIQAKDKE